ncbi:MAG TPA: helix-turn-helix transcriptional regulator [Polyangiaceae bacterium]|jgi:AraC-like DNA-binding protein|nr:helix-turn-helix transcriptional regulator [Polyangiaceae bacterium]
MRPKPPLFDARARRRAPISTLSWDYASGHVVIDHFHDTDQLVYAETGVMTVKTPRGTWVVPTRRAVWVPARMTHSIEMLGDVTMKTLYLQPRLAQGLPRACCVLHVAPLLRELVLHACGRADLETRRGPGARLVAVILDQLAEARSVPFQLPAPRDARARRVADALGRHPADPRPLDALATEAGASKRTIERAFRDETGMTFGKWRQQLRLLHASRLLAAGEKVTAAALDAGYESTSAFIAMFRRAMGVTPSRYFAPG